jgi:hypothetical protein
MDEVFGTRNAVNDPTADIPGWYTAVTAGEPYEANPVVAQLVDQLNTYRSPYHLPVPPPAQRVPVLSLQGTTDPLFPAVHTTQMVDRLRAASPGYPVWTFYGDLGHAYADNPHALWVAASTEANSWLKEVLAGTAPSEPRTSVTTTACVPGQTVVTFTADRLDQLSTSAWTFTSPVTALTSSATASGPEAASLDPIVNSGCRTVSTQSDPGVAAWAFTPPSAGTLLGSLVVNVTAALTGTNAELAARLFDVDPTGANQTLITRTVYRLTGNPGQTFPLSFELPSPAWQLQPGHQLRLELTQGDAPTWHADTLASTLQLSDLQLTVPIAN